MATANVFLDFGGCLILCWVSNSVWWFRTIVPRYRPKLYDKDSAVQYGAVITRSFLSPIPHKIHPIARLLGRGMACILWVKTVVYTCTLPQSTQWFMQNYVTLDCVKMWLDCICKTYMFHNKLVYFSLWPSVLWMRPVVIWVRGVAPASLMVCDSHYRHRQI